MNDFSNGVVRSRLRLESLEVRDTPAALAPQPPDGTGPADPVAGDPSVPAQSAPLPQPADPAAFSVPPTGGLPPVGPTDGAPIATSAPNPVAPAPYVTLNFAGMEAIQQLSITIRLNNDVVSTVFVNLTAADYDATASGVAIATKVANTLRANGIDATANGGVVTIWGDDGKTAQVASVNVSATQLLPGAEPSTTRLPTVGEFNGATASPPRFNLPRTVTP